MSHLEMSPVKPDRRTLKSKAGEWLLAQGLGAVIGCAILYAAYQLVPELIREQRLSNERNVDTLARAMREEGDKDREAYAEDQKRDEQRYNRLFDQAFPADKAPPVATTATGELSPEQ